MSAHVWFDSSTLLSVEVKLVLKKAHLTGSDLNALSPN
jgi:hypothetical protein